MAKARFFQMLFCDLWICLFYDYLIIFFAEIILTHVYIKRFQIIIFLFLLIFNEPQALYEISGVQFIFVLFFSRGTKAYALRVVFNYLNTVKK